MWKTTVACPGGARHHALPYISRIFSTLYIYIYMSTDPSCPWIDRHKTQRSPGSHSKIRAMLGRKSSM